MLPMLVISIALLFLKEYILPFNYMCQNIQNTFSAIFIKCDIHKRSFALRYF